MLLPHTHAWARWQKWLIVSLAIVTLATFGALIYGYERYYRGPSEAAFFGTWQGTVDWHGNDWYFQFGADHTFSIWMRWLEDADKEPEFVAKGRWYAGGRFLYLRYSSEFRPDGPELDLWLIDDVSPQELRLKYWRNGGIHPFHRVDSVTTRASNPALQPTAGEVEDQI